MAINQYFVFIIDSTERPVPGTIQMLNFSPWYRITFLKSVSQNFHLLTLSFLSTYNRFLTLCFTFAFEKWFDRYYCVIWACKVATFPKNSKNLRNVLWYPWEQISKMWMKSSRLKECQGKKWVKYQVNSKKSRRGQSSGNRKTGGNWSRKKQEKNWFKSLRLITKNSFIYFGIYTYSLGSPKPISRWGPEGFGLAQKKIPSGNRKEIQEFLFL